MAHTDAVPQRRTVNYPWVAFGACLTLLLGWGANAALAFVTDWSGSLAWLAVPAATVLVTVMTAITTAHVKSYEPQPGPVVPGAAADRAGTRSRPFPFVVSAILVAVFVGVLGLGLTLGVRFAFGWVTGDEPGVDRLVAPTTQTEQGLTITVESLEQTRHFTRVTAVATNRVGNPIRLNLFGNVILQGRNGSTLEADSFRSDWVEELPPGATQRGVIVFSGHLPTEVRFARLSFSTVWEQGFDGPRSIAVTGLRLRPQMNSGEHPLATRPPDSDLTPPRTAPWPGRPGAGRG